ncbi:adenylyl-sulfate kinase [Thermosulfuriphilus sp.]
MEAFTIWFTGLSGSGKTTLSRKVYLEIRRRGLKAELLDGDIIRTNFSQELGFTKKERDINVRRIGFLSWLLNKHGIISVVAAIAPYEDTRRQNRLLIPHYIEVFCNCPLEVVEARDVKGLYARARAGKIPNFTGISDPYEIPKNPEVVVYTDKETVEESLGKILSYLEDRELIPFEPLETKDYAEIEEEERRLRRHLAQIGYARKEW